MAKEEKTTKQTEVKVQLFSHQEVLAELLRVKGIHEGRWQLVFELGHAATTINALVAEGVEPIRLPVGMVLIQRMGIAPTREVSNLTLDAAEVNPLRGTRKKTGKKK